MQLDAATGPRQPLLHQLGVVARQRDQMPTILRAEKNRRESCLIRIHQSAKRKEVLPTLQ
jgi:hypothetical protein